MKISTPPHPEKTCPFPSIPPLKIEFLSSPLLLKIWLEVQSPRIDGMISPATWNGCLCMVFPPFITRLLDFWGFSFVIAHFRATTVFCKAILEAGVKVVSKLTASMNAQSTGIDFLVDRGCHGNPACLTYSKITLNAARNKITDMVHSISFLNNMYIYKLFFVTGNYFTVWGCH